MLIDKPILTIHATADCVVIMAEDHRISLVASIEDHADGLTALYRISQDRCLDYMFHLYAPFVVIGP